MMNKLLIPKLYYKDIYSINYKKLKDKNITYLLFDIDNTIADNRDNKPSKEAIQLINKLKKDFTIILVSNALPLRAKRFGQELAVDYYAFSIKPLKNTYKKIISTLVSLSKPCVIISKYNINPSNIAAIGDQLYTDILGANKMGIISLLIDRISNNESIITKFNRIRENKIIKKYKIIERGHYND